MKRLIPVLLFVVAISLLLAACAPDPRREADAFATRTQAEQDALDREQARAHDEELHNINIQNIKAAQAQWQTSMQKIVKAFQFAAPIATVAVTFAAGIALSIALIGSGKAAARFVEVRANLIQLNPATRQYPLLLQRVGKGLYSLTNPNTNSTLILNMRNETDRDMIRAMANVQYAGALAREARFSHRPGEISIIQPPHQIDIEDER